MPAVANRALSLATRGLLGGSVLALATHGLIQTAQPDIEIPVSPPAVATGGGSASTFVDYRDDFPVVPKRASYTFISGFTLTIDPASRAWLTECPLLRDRYVCTEWRLTLTAESEATYFDAGADEETLILLAAARWLLDEDTWLL